MESHEKLWELKNDVDEVSTMVRDGWVIICCDKLVRILALDNGEELHRLDHSSVCNNADFSPNMNVLAVACDTGVVIWDMKKVAKMKELDLAPEVQDLRFNPSGDKLIVGAHTGEIFKIEMK